MPYTISGSATAKVSTPLSGNIATSGGTGTLVIDTTASPNSFTGTQGLTISIDPAQNNPCVSATVSVTVLDTLAVSTNVQYVKVPAIWNGQYDSSNVLIGLTVKKYVWLPVPLGGETTVNVPTAVSVTRAATTGIISITATTPVAASSYNVGGYAVRLITAFDQISTGNLITGTVSTFYGYDDGVVPLAL